MLLTIRVEFCNFDVGNSEALERSFLTQLPFLIDDPMPELEVFIADASSKLDLPYADGGIQAGFPSPAQDSISEALDLNVALVRHPAATFYGKVCGDSMIDEGIEPGDILVIDRSLEPENGDLAVCSVDGEFTVKRIRFEKNRVWLIPSNELFDPIIVTPDCRFEVWGVVTHTIKNNRRRHR